MSHKPPVFIDGTRTFRAQYRDGIWTLYRFRGFMFSPMVSAFDLHDLFKAGAAIGDRISDHSPATNLFRYKI